MNKRTRTIFLSFILLCLVACGQKGALYLPQSQAQTNTTENKNDH